VTLEELLPRCVEVTERQFRRRPERIRDDLALLNFLHRQSLQQVFPLDGELPFPLNLRIILFLNISLAFM